MTVITEGAVLEALRAVQEPELGRDIVTLDMVKSIVIDGDAVAFTIELTTPACPLKDEIEGNTRSVLAGIGVQRRPDHLGRHGPPRPAAPGGAARAGRQEHHRGRVRQGRRRQEHGQRQPCRGTRPGGRQCRLARWRHHRPQHPADDGHRGPAQGERQQQDHAARALRRQDDLDPVLRPGRSAHRVARTARRRRDPAVPARRRMGRARLPGHRPAARARPTRS